LDTHSLVLSLLNEIKRRFFFSLYVFLFLKRNNETKCREKKRQERKKWKNSCGYYMETGHGNSNWML